MRGEDQIGKEGDGVLRNHDAQTAKQEKRVKKQKGKTALASVSTTKND